MATTTSTTTSSILTTLNAGSGIDWNQLAADLSAVQYQARNERLAAQAEVLETRISTASTIKSTLSSLASAIGEGVRTGNLSSQPSIATGAVASVSSPTGTSGKGSYSLEVLALARAQTLASPAFASSSEVMDAGTLTFRFGATTASGFIEDVDAGALEITIAAGATLADVARSINGAGGAVTAYVANTATGAQLVLKGAEGEAGGFIVEASGSGKLADLAWDPRAGGAPAQLLAGAQDASFRLDGLLMSSPTNSTGEVAPGLALVLTGANPGAPTTITFANPVDNISSYMTDVVTSLNEIVASLNTATAVGGDLTGDSGARRLRQGLSELAGQVVMPNAAAGAPRTLADLGLELQRDGTFVVDTQRLEATLQADPAGAAAMFTTGYYGVFATFDKLARNTASTTDPGSLGGSILRYQSKVSQISGDVAELVEKQEALRASMVTRFAGTNSAISSYQSTLSFLEQQIAVWNNSDD